MSPGTYEVAAFGVESDGRTVDVAAGQTATVTLRSRGATTIRGRVVDWRSGAGVTGMRCIPSLRTQAGTPIGVTSVVAFSDDDGAFVLEGAPAGAISVWCLPTTRYWTNGRVGLTLTGGQEATCTVPVVKTNPDLPIPDIGGAVERGREPPRFSVVQPNGAAQRAGIHAGDVIVTVDGADVTKLTPWAVQALILQRPVDSTVHLGLGRGGQAVTADLVLGSH